MAIRSKTEFIVLHCSATRANQASIGAAEIRAMHTTPVSRGGRGWSDIGYHWVIKRDGTVEQGRRPENSVGAHVEGWNAKTLGVCLVGGLNNATGRPEDNFTAAQQASLRRLVGELLRRYPTAKVLGHRDLSPDRNGDGIITANEYLKACPCFDARAWARANGFPAAPVRLRETATRTAEVGGAGALGIASLGGTGADALEQVQSGFQHWSAGTWVGVGLALCAFAYAGRALYRWWDGKGRPVPALAPDWLVRLVDGNRFAPEDGGDEPGDPGDGGAEAADRPAPREGRATKGGTRRARVRARAAT